MLRMEAMCICVHMYLTQEEEYSFGVFLEIIGCHCSIILDR